MTKRTLFLASFLLTTAFLADYSIPLPVSSAPVRQQQQTSSNWQQFFQRLVSRSPVPKKRGGGRGGVEMISPGYWSESLWSLKPVLIWRVTKAMPDQVEIVDVATQASVWKQPIQPKKESMVPVTVELKPGKTYFVKLLSKNAPIAAWRFKVMSSAERKEVTQALEQIDKTPKSRCLQPAERVQRRIEVFAKYGLWADAFQEIARSSLSVQERETAIAQLLDQLKSATAP